jgi:hypothetical protein
MEVEAFTKQQIFDTMCKLVEDQKKELAAKMEEQRNETKTALQEQHRSTTEILNEIWADLGDIQLQLERGTPKAATAPMASSTPISLRDDDHGPFGHGDDKFRWGEAAETAVLYVPPPARGAHTG